MIELIIDNSQCQVKNLPREHMSELRKILSYKVSENSNYYTGYASPIKYLIDKKGIFSTGLLYLVKRYVKDTHLHIEIEDRRRYV